MSWDWVVWFSGMMFLLVAVMVIMNLLGDDKRERENTKAMLGQLVGGLTLAVIVILTINFALKPMLAWIGTFLSKLF